LVILNSPCNPTGGVLSRETLEHVAAAARECALWVLSDEIYSRRVYEGEAPSIFSLPGMAEYLLNESGVALLVGTDFDARGEGYLRPSYANSRENIARALERIAAALGALR
jgi:aspartate/methionine/tyrosine aminotransferase